MSTTPKRLQLLEQTVQSVRERQERVRPEDIDPADAAFIYLMAFTTEGLGREPTPEELARFERLTGHPWVPFVVEVPPDMTLQQAMDRYFELIRG